MTRNLLYWSLQRRVPEKRKLARTLLRYRYTLTIPALIRDGHPIDALGAAFGMRFPVRHARARLEKLARER